MRLYFYQITFLFLAGTSTVLGQFRDVTTSLIDPTSIQMKGTNNYLLDFEKAVFGTLNLRFDSAPGDSLVIHLGEKLNEAGTLDRVPGGSIRYKRIVLYDPPVGKTFLLPLPADGRNDQPPAVLLPDSIGSIMPFRYCEIENLNIPIEKVNIRQIAYHYRFNEDASYFRSSDTTLNQIYDLSKHTIKATSFLGVYVDGDRERIPYEADAYINQLSHYAVDREYGPARETISYFMDHPTWPTEWLLHTLLMVYQDYMYTGNLELIRNHYEALKSKTLYELANEDGLISSFSERIDDADMEKIGFANPTERIRDIVDWPPAQKDTGWKLATAEGERDGHEMRPVNTVVNCFFYENMRILTEMAALLGKEADAIYFKDQAARTLLGINEKLFDTKRGIYIDGVGSGHASLHSNMLPLAFDLVPEVHKPSVVAYVKSRGMACSVYGAQYLLEGLFKTGAANYALDLMTATEGDRNWWNMLRSGSTMTLEAWDIRYKPNLDWNHAWGTAPLNIIPRYLWGITPASPGFEQVRIQPQMGDLNSSAIKVPTIKGPIEAKFEKWEKTARFTITLPTDVSGNFIVPDNAFDLFLNGEIQTISTSIPLFKGVNIISYTTH